MKNAIKIFIVIAVSTCILNQIQAQDIFVRKLTKGNVCASSKVNNKDKKNLSKEAEVRQEILSMNGRKVKTGSEPNTTNKTSKASASGKRIKREGEDTRLEILSMNGRKVKTGSKPNTTNKTSKASASRKRIKREGTDVRHEIFSMNGRKVKTGGN